MDARVTPGLRIGGTEFGPDDAALLRAVDVEGSLNAAAASLGRSYSRAHARIDALETATGPLVDRERGGSGGGGSELTPAARDLLARFDRLRAALRKTAETPETVLAGVVIERDGDLAVVEVPGGTVRARVVDPGRDDSDRVEVAIRSDAVTLHGTEGAPAAADTSARNRFAGTVTAVDRGASIVTVTVDVGADADLLALLTSESVERLGIVPGRAVVATFKATATRATPAGDDAR